MKLTRFILALVTLLLVAVNVVVSLLVNYASADIPRFLERNTNLIWMFIGLGIVVIFGLTVLQITLESNNKKVATQKKPFESVIRDSEDNSKPVEENGMQHHKYDVFVSYSHDNSIWVIDNLLKRLEEHHFRVFIDFRDFVTGKPGVTEMERGISESRHVLIVLSKSYVDSEWASFENIMAQTLDPTAIQRKIIPVLIEDCNIPLRLRILHYRDFRSNNDEQWELLIRDLS